MRTEDSTSIPIHKLTTAQTVNTAHWHANLRVNCGVVLKQAQPVVLARVARAEDPDNQTELLCANCYRVENDPILPCISFWEEGAASQTSVSDDRS